MLGVGGAGIVYEILHKTNGSRFALKEMEVCMRDMCGLHVVILKYAMAILQYKDKESSSDVHGIGGSGNAQGNHGKHQPSQHIAHREGTCLL